MRPMFFFLFLIFLQSAWAGTEFVDSPSQCFFKKSYPCRIHVTGGFLSFERSSQKFHLGDQSSLLFLSEGKIQLLQGELWVRDSRGLSIQVSPVFSMTSSGEIFLEKRSDDQPLLVRNLQGEVKFDSPFVFANEALPRGFQNWYGALDANKQVSRGVIRPIALTDFLKVWAPLSGFSIAEIRKTTRVYQQAWGDTLAVSADFYQDIVERRIASQEAKESRLENRHRQSLKERERLRQMFRQKNGFGDLHGL